MLERVKNLFSNIKFKRNIRHSGQEVEKIAKGKKVIEATGKLYKLWLLALPMLVGVSAGRLASVGIGYGLDAIANNAGVRDTAVTGAQVNAKEAEKQRGLDGFLAANPFKISPEKVEVPEPVISEEPKIEEPDTGLADLILRGTLPGVGAWIENKGTTKLLLIGKNVEEYKLMSVQYSEALFRKGKNTVTKYITYGPVAQAKKVETPPPTTASAFNPPPAQSQPSGNVVAAEPSGKEGEVSSETVQQLVQNPFDELKRIRIRPSESAGGLEIQWIQNDSILKKLGVQKGDVIRSVNGIPFTNMGDIANSINSLMNSERFDVEVTRGGQPTALRYVVR